MARKHYVPIKAVKAFAAAYRLDRVVVFASEEGGPVHVCSWGNSTEKSGQAADFGNNLKQLLGWPKSFSRQPSRVRLLQKRIKALEKEPWNSKRPTIDVEKQEAIVEALYQFARNLRDRKPDCKSAPWDDPKNKVAVNLSAVGDAVAEILATFGLEVAQVD